MDRVCIFIDGSNLYHQLKELESNLKIDYFKFSNALVGKDRKLIRTYYYICPPMDVHQDSYHDQHKFLSYLKNTPYLQLQYGSLESRGDSQVEKGIDVKLAVDMVSFAHNNTYDTAILISNDADLVPATDTIKLIGKHVEYAYLTRKTVSLVESCDRIIYIDDKMLQKCKA